MATRSSTTRWRGRRGRRVGRIAGGAVTCTVVGLLGVAGVAGPAAAAAKPSTVIKTASNKTWGKILVLGNGDTVYRLTADRHDKSVCTGACTSIWLPVTLAKGQRKPIGKGVKGLGTIRRPDGARQVTFDGEPLYHFVGDRKPGQANGNLRDTWGQWWVIDPARPHSPPVRVTSSHRRSTTSTTHSSGHSSGSSGGGGYGY
ncbi:MAG: COG4315 family predicted lipoprotein [Acidimicrobiales bacterium]